MFRSLLSAATVLLLIAVCGPVALLASWISGSSRPIFAVAFPAVRLALWVAGVSILVRGRERLDPEETYLFVANHVSNADPPVSFLAIGRHIRVLAKASLFGLPVFGSLLRAAEMIPVERDDRERAIQSVDLAAEALRAGCDFLIFAEGTRSADGRLQDLKKGPFVLAIKAGVPVVPMIVRGTREIQPKGSAAIRPGRAEVEFLAPVPTVGLTLEDRDDLRQRVARAMLRALAEPAGT